MFSEPVIGEKFFGRGEVLDLLNKRVSALKDGYRQNVALTGQSLSGKTSILHHFLDSIKDEDFITVYVEVVKEPFQSFANRFIATLLYNSLNKLGERAGFDLDELLEKCRELLPKTYAAIRQINLLIDEGELDDAYFNLLNITSTVKEEIKRSCVVILDEFDNLEEVGVKNPFLNFGKVIMIQKDTMYIVSSSRNQVFKKILSEKLSLLFGNFEIVKVSGFDMYTSALFIENRLDGFELDGALKRFLIAFTDGNPFYLDHILKKAKEIAFEKMTSDIDAASVGEAIMELIYNANGIIHQYLLNFILDLIDTKHKDRFISMLTAIANGKNKLTDISKTVRDKQSEVSKDLGKLADLGFISKNGVFHRVDDSVMAFWLKYVYQKRKGILVDGLLNRFELFNTEIQGYISNSLIKSESSVASRIAELFNSFANELVQIDSKQLKLPHFTKVELINSDTNKQLVVASFRGRSWTAQHYEHAVRESDIVDYIRNVKASDYTITNKIIIPLTGIEENAKLLAKELKISIWDISTLNSILNIYGKEKVVL